MVESNKKMLWMGLAAAGALVGAALLFHWANSADDDDETLAPGAEGGNTREKLQKDLEAASLIEVKKNQ